MRALLDTSVLVAALVRSHPAHPRCLPWLGRALAGELELVLAAHSLAELHAILTSLPVKPRISPRTARALAEENRLRPRPIGIAEVIALDVEDYLVVLGAAADRGIAGGAVYHALIARAAELAEVDELVTLDPEDFRRVWASGVDRVRDP